MIQIYDCNEIFLYEIIEDYKEAVSQVEKDEIFQSFCSSIWSSDNKRRTYTKKIQFHVTKDLLDTELGRTFDLWSAIEYKYYKPMTNEENWCSIIRQKINNIYTRYFDKEVILAKEYMDLIKTPKRLYYDWISGKVMNAASVVEILDEAIDTSEKVRVKLQQRKLSLTWSEYKKIVDGFLRHCFNNCKLIEEYEDKNNLLTRLDFLTEDHFYVRYFCRSLDGEIRKWQKKTYGLPQSSRKGYTRCLQCGVIIEKTGNKRKYCKECAINNERKRKRKIAYKYRVAK